MKIQEECEKIQKSREKGPILEKRCFLLANIGLSHGQRIWAAPPPPGRTGSCDQWPVLFSAPSAWQLLQTDAGDQICPLPTLCIELSHAHSPSHHVQQRCSLSNVEYQSRNSRIWIDGGSWEHTPQGSILYIVEACMEGLNTAAGWLHLVVTPHPLSLSLVNETHEVVAVTLTALTAAYPDKAGVRTLTFSCTTCNTQQTGALNESKCVAVELLSSPPCFEMEDNSTISLLILPRRVGLNSRVFNFDIDSKDTEVNLNS